MIKEIEIENFRITFEHVSFISKLYKMKASLQFLAICSTLFILLVFIISACNTQKQLQHEKLKALIIDGENNHGIWPKTTMMIKDYLEQTDLFQVDIERTSNTWQGPHHNVDVTNKKVEFLLDDYPLPSGKKTNAVGEPVPDHDFGPNFADYDVVVSNFGWKASKWSAKTQDAFMNYVKSGGGLVIVHAANNSWGEWDEYNKMIGLGGWGGRTTESGPYVFYDDNGNLVRDTSEGTCGSHGPQYEFEVTTRDADHPIMKGLPAKWLHTKDELYDRLRGPAENMNILATAYSAIEKNGPPWAKGVKGTGRHEPMLMTIDYGSGRIFHTIMGHMDYSMECVGFITTLQRGSEWAATQKVTQSVPKDFPVTKTTSSRSWKKS